LEKIVAVKGMNDILPNDSYKWLWLEEIFRQWLLDYGYSNIRTPIVESTKLFVRSIGEVTDIVEKEMYSFTDSLNGDNLTLRPEGTAGTLRAVVEHSLLYKQTQKIWYMGAMFRHERPQKGRYRQFHQLGVEALGLPNAEIDAEIILMLSDLWQRVGLTNLELHINCLGNSEERSNHKMALIEYLSQYTNQLDDEAKRRLHTNPLRILDTKNPQLQEIVTLAPRLVDYLGIESAAHYQRWKSLLSDLGISYIENPRLVRGLDYYNLSVFEWISSDLGSQSTVCGGGRYDPLIKELSGKDNYGIGFGLGIERLLLILESLGKVPSVPKTDIYIAVPDISCASYALQLANILRQNNYSVIQDFEGTSLKSQLKKADNSGAMYTLIIGENEVSNSQIMLKYMQEQKQTLIDVSSGFNNLLIALKR